MSDRPPPDDAGHPPGPPTPKPGGQEPKLQPAEEWGEGLDEGKEIARGGKTDGHVPGAEPDDKK